MEAGHGAAIHAEVTLTIPGVFARGAITDEANPAGAKRVFRTRTNLSPVAGMLPNRLSHHLKHLMATRRGFPAVGTHRSGIAPQHAAVFQHHQLPSAAIQYEMQALVVHQIGRDAAQGHVIADQRCRGRDGIWLARQGCAVSTL